jgi:hypothetical protein
MQQGEKLSTIVIDPGMQSASRQTEAKAWTTRLFSFAWVAVIAVALIAGAMGPAAFGMGGFGASSAYAAPDDGKGPDKPAPDDESEDEEEAEEEEEMTFELEDVCEFEGGEVWYDRVNPWVGMIGCEFEDGSDWWCLDTGTHCGRNWGGVPREGTTLGTKDPRQSVTILDTPQILEASGTTTTGVMFHTHRAGDGDGDTNVRDHRGQDEDGRACVSGIPQRICIHPDRDDSGTNIRDHRDPDKLGDRDSGSGGRPGGVMNPDMVYDPDRAVQTDDFGRPTPTPEPDPEPHTDEETTETDEGHGEGDQANDENQSHEQELDEPANNGPGFGGQQGGNQSGSSQGQAQPTDTEAGDASEELAEHNADELNVVAQRGGTSFGLMAALFALAGLAVAGPAGAIGFVAARRSREES